MLLLPPSPFLVVSGILFGDTDMEHGQYRLPRKCKCKSDRVDLKHPLLLLLTIPDQLNSDRHYPLPLAVKSPRKENGFLFFKKKIVHVRTNFRKGGLGIPIFHYLYTSLLYLLIAATKHDVEANQKRGRTTPSAAPASPFPLIQQPINQSS